MACPRCMAVNGGIGWIYCMSEVRSPIEQAPIVNQFDRGVTFKGTGNSHFTFVEDEGFHETTEVPGLRQKDFTIKTRFDIDDH